MTIESNTCVLNANDDNIFVNNNELDCDSESESEFFVKDKIPFANFENNLSKDMDDYNENLEDDEDWMEYEEYMEYSGNSDFYLKKYDEFCDKTDENGIELDDIDYIVIKTGYTSRIFKYKKFHDTGADMVFCDKLWNDGGFVNKIKENVKDDAKLLENYFGESLDGCVVYKHNSAKDLGEMIRRLNHIQYCAFCCMTAVDRVEWHNVDGKIVICCIVHTCSG